MRFLAALGALCWLAAFSLASGQVQIGVETQRTNFLLYERVDLIVSIANASESDLVLNNDEGHPWLSFLVSKHNRLPVPQERTASFKSLTLKVGETKRLRVNITPLFSFRDEGDYTAQVVVDLPGAGQVISDPVGFSILHGREVWSETRPVGGSQRVYSLIRFSPQPNTTSLYLRVEDPSENIVYANVALGKVVAFIDPEVFFDPEGSLHVMQPIADSTYLYSRANPDGQVVHHGIFTSIRSVAPRLAKLNDGNVIVLGGEEENQPRETLSVGQKLAGNQPPPQPVPLNSGASPDPDSDPIPPPPSIATPGAVSAQAGTPIISGSGH